MKKTIPNIMIIVIVFCIGMYLVPIKMMNSDLSSIPGNLGDARLNNYFLEHGYRWLTGQEESFWNAPFFYPAISAITYSDNHLGTLPFYALFRLVSFDRETSYQLWFIALFTLNYVCCAWVLKKLSINALGAAAGAFVFTFALPVIARIGHSQLLPRFMIPIAFYHAFLYLEKPQLRHLILLCSAIIIQFYCTMYMGFFLVLGLILFMISFSLLNTQSSLYALFYHSKEEFLKRIIVIIVSLVVLMPLILPYYATALEYGTRSWSEISSMLPRWRSYLYPAGGSLLWHWLDPIGASLPMSWEHQIFIGALPLAAFIVMPVVYLRNRTDLLAQRGMIVFITLLFIFLLTTYFGLPQYKLALALPGLKAIRAVTRIMLLNVFLLSVIMGVLITKLIDSQPLLRRFPGNIFIAVLILGVVSIDQHVPAVNYPTYSKAESQDRAKLLSHKIKSELSRNAKVFAYMPDKNIDPDYVVHLDAMFAAQNLNMATVNGYSGGLPANYDFFLNYESCDSLFKWQALSGKKYGAYYGKEDIFKDLVISGRSCTAVRASYTAMTGAMSDESYRAKISFEASRISVRKNEKRDITIHLANRSSTTWSCLSAAPDGRFRILLSYRWLSNTRTPIGGFDSRVPLPKDLQPGETAALHVPITVPSISGTYYIEFDLVQELVAWFRDKGSKTAVLKVTVL